jgi:hypothetical protein
MTGADRRVKRDTPSSRISECQGNDSGTFWVSEKGEPMAGHLGAAALLALWTIWLLVALAFFPIWPDPGTTTTRLRATLLLCFLTSAACFPMFAHHIAWRGFLMLWLVIHAGITGAAVREVRRNGVPAAISVIGLLWLGFTGGGVYAEAIQFAATALIVIGLVIACGWLLRRGVAWSQAERAASGGAAAGGAPAGDEEPDDTTLDGLFQDTGGEAAAAADEAPAAEPPADLEPETETRPEDEDDGETEDETWDIREILEPPGMDGTDPF